MLSLVMTAPRQGRIYTYSGRYCRLLVTLSELLIGNGYTAIGCLNPDTDAETSPKLLAGLFKEDPTAASNFGKSSPTDLAIFRLRAPVLLSRYCFPFVPSLPTLVAAVRLIRLSRSIVPANIAITNIDTKPAG